MRNTVVRIIRTTTALTFAVHLSACGFSLSQIDFNKAEKAASRGQYSAAIEKYKKILQRQPESELAITAAQNGVAISLYEAKDFLSAIEFYKHLVRYSKSEKQRRGAQEGMANTYLEKLMNYDEAIKEFNKLIVLKNDTESVIEYRKNLARAHFARNQFFEALTELEQALKMTKEPSKKYDLLLLKGNILFNTKEIAEALKVYEQIIVEYPDRSRAEKILMNVAVCYEEIEQFDKAIAKLDEMRPDYEDKEFVDLKISRLKERKANMPGSKGLRK